MNGNFFNRLKNIYLQEIIILNLFMLIITVMEDISITVIKIAKLKIYSNSPLSLFTHFSPQDQRRWVRRICSGLVVNLTCNKYPMFNSRAYLFLFLTTDTGLSWYIIEHNGQPYVNFGSITGFSHWCMSYSLR